MTRLPPPFTPHTPLPLSRLSGILSSLFSVPSFFFFFLSEIHRKETRWHRVRKEKSCGANNTMSSLPVSPVLLRATLRGHTSACFVGLVVKRRSLLTSKLLHLCGNKKKKHRFLSILCILGRKTTCFVLCIHAGFTASDSWWLLWNVTEVMRQCFTLLHII